MYKRKPSEEESEDNECRSSLPSIDANHNISQQFSIS